MCAWFFVVFYMALKRPQYFHSSATLVRFGSVWSVAIGKSSAKCECSFKQKRSRINTFPAFVSPSSIRRSCICIHSITNNHHWVQSSCCSPQVGFSFLFGFLLINFRHFCWKYFSLLKIDAQINFPSSSLNFIFIIVEIGWIVFNE